MEEGTAGEAEASTEAALGAGFMAGEAAFTEEEDSPAVTLDLMADIRLAVDSGAASMAAGALMVAGDLMVAGALAGAAEVGAAVGADEDGVGAGDLAGAGRIGDMAGDILMATTATARITLILTIPTRPMVLRKTT